MSFTVRLHILLLCFILVIIPPALAADAASNVSHVRTTEPRIAALLRNAMLQSPVFRELVTQLAESDVIVYVKTDRQLPIGLAGHLRFAGSGGGRRYVVVTLQWGATDMRTMSALGHELRHALEIAERPDIVDAPTLARAFAGFAQQSTHRGAYSFETDAAVETGERIWSEVSQGPAQIAVREVDGRQ